MIGKSEQMMMTPVAITDYTRIVFNLCVLHKLLRYRKQQDVENLHDEVWNIFFSFF